MTEALPILHAEGPPLAPLHPCECDYCRRGTTTVAHGDASHDQRLEQYFQLAAARLHIRGGTTKCARLALGYALAQPEAFRGRRVVELGAGAGLVGIGLAVGLGCDVTLTDQAPVQDLLRANLAVNVDPARHRARCTVLQWGGDIDPMPADIVIGTDLHFAQENAPALLQTLRALCGPSQTLLLATIRRADWESVLYVQLERCFRSELLSDAGDAQLWRYTRRAASSWPRSRSGLS